jgi:hypothetical protein
MLLLLDPENAHGRYPLSSENIEQHHINPNLRLGFSHLKQFFSYKFKPVKIGVMYVLYEIFTLFVN